MTSCWSSGNLGKAWSEDLGWEPRCAAAHPLLSAPCSLYLECCPWGHLDLCATHVPPSVPPVPSTVAAPERALSGLVQEHLWCLVVISHRIFNIERACAIDLMGPVFLYSQAWGVRAEEGSLGFRHSPNLLCP